MKNNLYVLKYFIYFYTREKLKMNFQSKLQLSQLLMKIYPGFAGISIEYQRILKIIMRKNLHFMNEWMEIV